MAETTADSLGTKTIIPGAWALDQARAVCAGMSQPMAGKKRSLVGDGADQNKKARVQSLKKQRQAAAAREERQAAAAVVVKERQAAATAKKKEQQAAVRPE